MPLRSSRRCVTRRTVMESSTTSATMRRSSRSRAPTACNGARPRQPARTSAPMSRITTMRPSPRMVAPDTPRMPAICGPTGFTTISRVPIISSATTPVESSPARTSTTGNVGSSSGSGPGSRPTKFARCCRRYLWPPYRYEGSALSRCCCNSSRAMRTTPSMVGMGSAYCSSPTRTMTAWPTDSDNGRRIMKREPLPAECFHQQRAAQLLHLVGHHVHAHAATGGLGQVLGGGETGLEDQLHGLLVGELPGRSRIRPRRQRLAT